MKTDPTLRARELVTQARVLASDARAEAHRLHFILARRAESRALLKLAGSADNCAERLNVLADTAEHARPLLVDEKESLV